MSYIKQFIDAIIEANKFHAKYLAQWNVSSKKKQELDEVLQYWIEEKKYSIEKLVDSYMFINQIVWEETRFFIENGNYRYSKVQDVENAVYNNSEYMEKYMLGLALSQYIWSNHIKMSTYFEDNLDNLCINNGSYLEIGPGYGEYLVKAIKNGGFSNYYACDLSVTSVKICNDFLEYKGLINKCSVEHKNFFDYTAEDCFDCIVMGEVLEHVENPLEMLKKIYEILNNDGRAFITTVINAPMLDHIYLFSDIESVLSMVQAAGFRVNDYMVAIDGKSDLKSAIQQRRSITIAIIVSK